MDSMFHLKTFNSDTMLNYHYHLSQQLKLIGIEKFNHLNQYFNIEYLKKVHTYKERQVSIIIT